MESGSSTTLSSHERAPAFPSLQAFANGWQWEPWLDLGQQALDYSIDVWQRSILFLDIMRQRGNNYYEHTAQRTPNVLTYDFRIVKSGFDLARPVNYGLVEILPPSGTEVDPKKRPFVIFDPRAGHGPGIGGMKPDSEIGVALAAGHPCYFVGFSPDPVAGQTIEDVCRAEAMFVREVAKRHPEADGKPCLIGNCQAGWQIIMMAAIEPEIAGPIMLAGSPLSYWNGVHGKNPLRYLGGLLGGTWLTSFASDLGDGIFDGAYLVANFEALNPANTYWEKAYNVFSKVDTEGPRFLDFETWWGSPTLLNAGEMQAIADDLFVGNKLSSGDLYSSDGIRVDLRKVQSPIIVFCSFGDDITPPQQALGWILDLYDTDEQLIRSGQTIIYLLHQTIGHLGIFVSAKVATKEHQEMTQAMDLIDVLPPGLYEAVLLEKQPGTTGSELAAGNYIVRFETRTLQDIRALGGNDAEDDLRFAAVARLSEINQGLYRSCVSPFVRTLSTRQSAERLRKVHPYRLRYEIFSDKNALAQPLARLAEQVRSERRPVRDDNIFQSCQKEISRQIVRALDLYQENRDQLIENWFLSFYGSALLQAMLGLRADSAIARRKIGHDVMRQAEATTAKADVDARIERGGLREAAIRALLYVGHSRGSVDERAFAVMRQIRARNPEWQKISPVQFKELVREQSQLLRLDEKKALAALPKLLPIDSKARAATLDDIRQVISATVDPQGTVKDRLSLIEGLFKSAPAPGKRLTEDARPRASTGGMISTMSESPAPSGEEVAEKTS